VVSHHRRPVHADGAPGAIGAYSHAVVSNELVEGGAGEQTRRCLDNLAAVCVAGGTTLADAVRVTVYAEDLAGDWAEINDAYSAYFGEAGAPARAAVGVAALPRGARVEIDAVVALPD
jgi:2-iminobutanoate/2-iminopropanoate deaminase